MRITFGLGNVEKSQIEFERDPVCGRMSIVANGKVVASSDPARFCTHFNLKPLHRYEFLVGTRERHEVAIEHERPCIAATPRMSRTREHNFRVFVDGELIQEVQGA